MKSFTLTCAVLATAGALLFTGDTATIVLSLVTILAALVYGGVQDKKRRQSDQ